MSGVLESGSGRVKLRVRISGPPRVGAALSLGENFVELQPSACVCGGFTGAAAWDSTRRPCDDGAGPAIGIVVDTRRWRALGSPRSEEAFREALAAAP